MQIDHRRRRSAIVHLVEEIVRQGAVTVLYCARSSNPLHGAAHIEIEGSIVPQKRVSFRNAAAESAACTASNF